MMGFYNNDYGWGVGGMLDWYGGWFMMIVFWVLVIAFIAWVARETTGNNSKSSSGALDILKERYAKGEINQAEFKAKKKDIAS